MKCVIPGPNIKVLGRAIHSLAKLGEELYLESTENEVFFRTANSSKTAYASYCFSSDFFSFFEHNLQRRNDSVTCQISMRSALSVFRSPLTLDKTTESMQIQFHQKSDKIIFTVKYRKGVVKTFNVPIIDCESLQAYYQKDSSPNSVTIQPRIVGDVLSHFQSTQDEITWKVTRNNIVIKNFSEAEEECKGIRTEISVDKEEFDRFHIETETELTFCLKELRAVLMFSDSVSLPLTANFNVCSKPIVFVIKSDCFEVNTVVSTLTGPESTVLSNNHEECGGVGHSEDKNETAESSMKASVTRTPGVEKLKRVFQRCFDKDLCDIRNMPGYDVVLASDSDNDDDDDG